MCVEEKCFISENINLMLFNTKSNLSNFYLHLCKPI